MCGNNQSMAQIILQKIERTQWIGRPLPRKEDLRFITGKGRYTSDFELPNTAYVVIARSPYANARIVKIDASKALELPGVLAVITGEDVAEEINPFPNLLPHPYNQIKDYGIAINETRYAGEPVALIVAENMYTAHDALELLNIEYEPRQPIISAEEAMRDGSPRVHENIPSNVVWHKKFTYGDVDEAFKKADLIVKKRLYFHRFTSAPLEPNAIIVSYDSVSGVYTIISNNQRPVFNQHAIAHALKIPTNKLHFISPDIGGGFGIKNDSYPYIVLLAIASKKVNRPVKWIETRQEHMMASTHGNEVVYYGEMAFRKDGTILGLRAKAIHDEGAYMRREPIGAFNFIRHATLTYRFRNLEMDVYAVVTNKCPVGPNRSYGKMQQNYLVEVLIDMGARELGIDPIEIRMKNFVRSEEMPYETPTGALLDGGDYPKVLERVCELVNYSALKREQREARKKGKIVGIGVAMGMDASPINFSSNRIINPAAEVSGESEAAWVKVNEDGSIIASVGTSPQGHGHETSVAQIVADVLGVDPDQVHVVQGFDSWVNPSTPHSGTYASRFAIAGASAVYGGAMRVKSKILQIASYILNVPTEKLDIVDGKIAVNGVKQDLDIKKIAQYAWKDLARLPENIEPGLFAYYVYRTPFKLPKDDKSGNFSLTYSYSACIVYIEVDAETGFVKIKRVGIVEDCGKQINPLIVEGQIHGQLGHQLGAALYEKLVYDESGQLLTSSFLNYWAPTALELPSFEVDSIITPSLFTPLGTRGMGEGGGAPLIACVNALNDALSIYGLEFTESHLDPTKIRELVKRAKVSAIR